MIFSPPCWPSTLSALACTVGIDLDGDRRQALGEADALLQRLGHFLVVQGVGRRIDQAAAIGDGDAAPAVQQAGDVGRAAFSAAACARSARIARAWAMNSSAISRSSSFQLARTAVSPRSATSVS